MVMAMVMGVTVTMGLLSISSDVISMTASTTERQRHRTPPRLVKRGGIQTAGQSDGDGRTTIGYHGPIPSRNAYGVAKPVTRERHRFRALDAYAISMDALSVIGSIHEVDDGYTTDDPVSIILIAEEDTGRVYEFDASLFLNPDEHGADANRVPDKFLHDVGDKQVYATTGAATAWDGLADDVFVTDDTDSQKLRLPADADGEVTEFQSGLEKWEAEQ